MRVHIRFITRCLRYAVTSPVSLANNLSAGIAGLPLWLSTMAVIEDRPKLPKLPQLRLDIPVVPGLLGGSEGRPLAGGAQGAQLHNPDVRSR
jgi:hypothetical protein